MRICTNFLSPVHYSSYNKRAQIIPEQTLSETVYIYTEAIPYIECEIRSTIQHEAGHRKDEEGRYEEFGRTRQRGRQPHMPSFDEFSSESRVEPIAEREEENCQHPAEISGQVQAVDLNELFNRAKTSAQTDPNYKRDIKAGSLDPNAQGSYLLQELPLELQVKQTDHPNTYDGFDGTLWVDVRKIAGPFIAQQTDLKSQPATYQDDGVTPDVPNVSQQPPTSYSIPAVPSSRPIPPVGAR